MFGLYKEGGGCKGYFVSLYCSRLANVAINFIKTNTIFAAPSYNLTSRISVAVNPHTIPTPQTKQKRAAMNVYEVHTYIYEH